MKKQSKPSSKLEAVYKVHKLVKSKGYIYTLIFLTAKDLFIGFDEFAEIDWQEKLSFQELTFLYGLLIKEPIDLAYIPDIKLAESYATDTYRYLHEMHMNYSMDGFKAMFEKTEAIIKQSGVAPENPPLFESPEAIIEAVFYDNSGAYDFQYWESAPRRYRRDSTWIVDNYGFEIENAVTLSKLAKNLTEKKYRSRPHTKKWEEICNNLLSVFTISEKDFFADLPEKITLNILSTFSVQPGKCNAHLSSPENTNELNYKPLIQLGNKRYLFPISFNLARAVDESPYYWMGNDAEYAATAFDNRGKYAESRAFELLTEVFGKKVYRNVKISQVKSHTITDIDVLAILGNKAIVIQTKSQKMNQKSQHGDLVQMGKDFAKAVQNAYEQGILSRKHILAKNAIFTGSDGKKLDLDESINEAYILVVTSDNYPALEMQARTLLARKSEDPPPVAINMFDLDLLVTYLPDPYDFTYYLNQRISLGEKIFSGNEMAYLGFHLKHKLFWDPAEENSHQMLDQSFAQLLDDDVVKRKYGDKKTIDKLHNQWKNDKYAEIVEQIKSASDPGFVDAIFFLYSLASDTIDYLIEQMQKAREKVVSRNKPYSFAMPTGRGSGGITYVVTNEHQDLRSRILQYSAARKHKSKANEWLGLGSYVTSSRVIDCVVYNGDKWEEDKDMDDLAQMMLKPNPQIIKRKIGRNDRCYCGSGLKYKKCHYFADNLE